MSEEMIPSVNPSANSPPGKDWAFVTYFLIMLNVVVFLYQRGDPQAVKQAAFVPADFWTDPSKEWPSILSSMFTHSGVLHLYFNMYTLLRFGTQLEGQYADQPWLYGGLYMFSGIASTLAYALLNPSGTTGVVGASGAISGLLAAAWLNNKESTSIAIYIGLQLLYMFFDSSRVSYVSHLLGFVAGALYYWVFMKETQ